VLWPVCCKNPAADWCFPEVHPLPGENVVLKTLRFGSPLFVLDSERRFGSLRQGIAEPGLSNYASAITCRAIRRKKPDLTAVHLIDLDEMLHHHGVFSPEAREAVSRNEDRLNRIRQALEETPGMEDALLIAVSDHGQSDISVTVNLTDRLKQLGLSSDFGVQSNGESAYFFALREGADAGRAMGVLSEHLEECGILRLYSREDLDRMHVDALSAILLHNSLYKFSIAFYKDKEKRKAPLKMELHPLAWMLMLCDELQCWDRIAYGRNSRRELHPMAADFDFSDNRINATYYYDEE
jgi:hypothetical protein